MTTLRDFADIWMQADATIRTTLNKTEQRVQEAQKKRDETVISI